MKHAIVACLVTALPMAVHADYVATEEEEAALRASIAKKPPTAETLTAQPYPGSKLDVTCSASQSAPRQPETMVYCFYTRDASEKVEAYVQGPGKPADSVPVFVRRGEVVDERNTVLIPDVTHVIYYVRTAPAAANGPAPMGAHQWVLRSGGRPMGLHQWVPRSGGYKWR